MSNTEMIPPSLPSDQFDSSSTLRDTSPRFRASERKKGISPEFASLPDALCTPSVSRECFLECLKHSGLGDILRADRGRLSRRAGGEFAEPSGQDDEGKRPPPRIRAGDPMDRVSVGLLRVPRVPLPPAHDMNARSHVATREGNEGRDRARRL